MPPGDPVPASELDGFRIEREKAMAIFVAASDFDSSSSSSGTTEAQ
jgi:hypothetical protein